ncbi:MAG: polymer-forming cytoskeletal protein [Acidobacteriales bacterium]|nr:polymer-forming cytoskeletal protein [Terriglobales bacterium]
MLQSKENFTNANFFAPANNPNPVKTTSTPMEQATIGRSLVIKGEVSGAESLYIDGKVEGSINVPDHRVTIGRNGNVAANINAKEVVIMGKVKGNVHCSDRVDIRGEGFLAGDIVTQRISVEDGALLKGSVQVRAAEQKTADNKSEKNQNNQSKPADDSAKHVVTESPKAAATVAG